MPTEHNTTNGDIAHRFIETNGLRMHIAEQGSGPLVLLCHGFPELWRSWQYQVPALAQAGYHAVAPDLRGYGQSDAPAAVEAYTLLHLVGDLVGVLDALGEREAVLVSHDWGSIVAWQAALMRPDRFPALVTMSAPYLPRGPLVGARAALSPTQSWQQTFRDRFFYQVYFQQPGVAEAELERDVRATMRRLFYGLSGDAPQSERWHPVLPASEGDMLNTSGNPTILPAWISEEEIELFAAEFARTGFRGGLNWYRNIDRNWELLAAYSGASIRQPALFLWGEQDPLLELGGIDKQIERMQQFVPNLQKKSFPGCGHWVPQERAQEVNAALIAFLRQ